MKALDKLESLLNDDPKVKQFKTLETAIFANKDLMKKYQSLLEKQKRMVQAKEKNRPNKDALIREYEKTINEIKDNPIIDQYLTLQEEINEDIKMMFQMVEQGIND